MTTPEYKRIRNGLLYASIPIIAVVIFQAFSVYFTMENKVDRSEYQQGLYEITLIMERKTMALEKIATGNEKTNLRLLDEVDKLNERIDKMYERQNRLRTAIDNN